MFDRAAVLTLPRALLANIVGDELVEGAVAADHEDVVVGDGAEGLVLHRCVGAEATRRSGCASGDGRPVVRSS